MALIKILAGVALLLFGRKLFWLFVAAVGFAAASMVATSFVQGEQEWIVLAIAIAAGLCGAVLAIIVQRAAVVVAGFAGGAFLAYTLNPSGMQGAGDQLPWVLILVGGILGAIVLAMLFDWALIVLSSILGAVFLFGAVTTQTNYAVPAVVLLSLGGMAFQAMMKLRRRSRSQPQ